MLGRVVDDLRTEQGITLSITSEAEQQLGALCLADLNNGGRGIRNQVEVNLVNPLARALFELDPKPGDRIVVDGLSSAGGITTLSLSRATT